MPIRNPQTKTYQSSEKLLDGRILNLRPIRPSDKIELEAGFEQLSKQSRYFRFFQHKKYLTDKELQYLTEIDFVNHVALVASVLEKESQVPVGIGRYIVIDDNKATVKTAEIAFAVEDSYHGLGVATILLKHLSAIARDNDIEYFRADVLANNYKMLEVFDNCGLSLEKRLQGIMLEVMLRLS